MSDYYDGCYTPTQVRSMLSPLRGPLCEQDVIDADLEAGRLRECQVCGNIMRPAERCPCGERTHPNPNYVPPEQRVGTANDPWATTREDTL